MKIALVNHTFSLSHGGLERVSVNLVTALRDNGDDVHVFSHRHEDLPEGVHLHHIDMARKPSFWRILSFARNARKALEDGQYDVIYGLTRLYPLDVYRLGDGIQRHWMKLRYPVTVWRWINYLVNPTHLANAWLERKLLQGTQCRIITNSELVKKHVETYYSVAEERIDVIYNSVNHDIFCPDVMARYRGEIRRDLGIGENEKIILYVSNNWKRKGLATIIQALSQMSQSTDTYRLLVVGRGRPRRFETLAKRLGVDGRIHFAGPTKEIQKYYADADLLVLPTQYDPFANVCLEAMACGVPVVTTMENGAAELINEGENGCLLNDADDPTELAIVLERLSQADLKSMGAHARSVAITFTPEKNLTHTIKTCREIIACHG